MSECIVIPFKSRLMKDGKQITIDELMWPIDSLDELASCDDLLSSIRMLKFMSENENCIGPISTDEAAMVLDDFKHITKRVVKMLFELHPEFFLNKGE